MQLVPNMHRKLNGVILKRLSGAKDYLLSKKKKKKTETTLKLPHFHQKEIIQDTPTA